MLSSSLLTFSISARLKIKCHFFPPTCRHSMAARNPAKSNCINYNMCVSALNALSRRANDSTENIIFRSEARLMAWRARGRRGQTPDTYHMCTMCNVNVRSAMFKHQCALIVPFATEVPCRIFQQQKWDTNGVDMTKSGHIHRFALSLAGLCCSNIIM